MHDYISLTYSINLDILYNLYIFFLHLYDLNYLLQPCSQSLRLLRYHIDMPAAKAAVTEKHGLPSPPNDSPPPPTYVQGNPNQDVPDITAAFSNLNLSHSPKPTPDRCIAHLKLLEAFHQLREDVSFEDGRFGIHDSFSDVVESHRERDEILAKIREKRWQIYVTKASKRFERWWASCVEPNDEKNRLLGQSRIPFIFKQSPDIGEALEWTKDQMPPLGKCYGDFWSTEVHTKLRNRRDNGLACIHVESERLSRGLPSSREDEILESWITLGDHQLLH